MAIKSLSLAFVASTLIASPTYSQATDVLGLLRQDGVALVFFEATPQGVAFASRSSAAARYYVRSEHGRAGIAAEAPVDLADDDHVWGQRTNFSPVIAESNEWPIPRAHYFVSDTIADSPFQLVEDPEPNPDHLLSLLDSLGPPADPTAAPLESRRVWRATLDGESAVFFDAARIIRRANGACFDVSGWLTTAPAGPRLQVVGSGEDGCASDPQFRPWALIRRNGSFFALVELLGPGFSRPQLWQRGLDGTWAVILG